MLTLLALYIHIRVWVSLMRIGSRADIWFYYCGLRRVMNLSGWEEQFCTIDNHSLFWAEHKSSSPFSMLFPRELLLCIYYRVRTRVITRCSLLIFLIRFSASKHFQSFLTGKSWETPMLNILPYIDFSNDFLVFYFFQPYKKNEFLINYG